MTVIAIITVIAIMTLIAIAVVLGPPVVALRMPRNRHVVLWGPGNPQEPLRLPVPHAPLDPRD
eukprot:9771119-Lingulodinium_polyedra.AAC.1